MMSDETHKRTRRTCYFYPWQEIWGDRQTCAYLIERIVAAANAGAEPLVVALCDSAAGKTLETALRAALPAQTRLRMIERAARLPAPGGVVPRRESFDHSPHHADALTCALVADAWQREAGPFTGFEFADRFGWAYALLSERLLSPEPITGKIALAVIGCLSLRRYRADRPLDTSFFATAELERRCLADADEVCFPTRGLRHIYDTGFAPHFNGNRTIAPLDLLRRADAAIRAGAATEPAGEHDVCVTETGTSDIAHRSFARAFVDFAAITPDARLYLPFAAADPLIAALRAQDPGIGERVHLGAWPRVEYRRVVLAEEGAVAAAMAEVVNVPALLPCALTTSEARHDCDFAALRAGLGPLAPIASRPPPARSGLPLVSVLITNYNLAEYLPDAIASVEKASYGNVEVILVDDHSPGPRDQALVRELATGEGRRFALKTIVNTTNLGLAASRNVGLAHAQGDYVLPLDADDLLEPDFIALAVRTLEKYPNYFGVAPTLAYFSSQGDLEAPRAFATFMGDITEFGLVENRFAPATALLRAKMLRELGYDDRLSSYEDWDLYLRAALAGKRILVTNDVKFRYRQREGSMVRSFPLTRRYELMAQIFAKLNLPAGVGFAATLTPSRRLAARTAELEAQVAELQKQLTSAVGQRDEFQRNLESVTSSRAWRALEIYRYVMDDTAAGRMLTHLRDKVLKR